MDQQTLKRNQLKYIMQSILNRPILKPIPNQAIQLLQWGFKNAIFQKNFLFNISKALVNQQKVIIRLKCWAMIHLLLSSNIVNETALIIQNFIIEFQNKIKAQSEENIGESADKYFFNQVELPYRSFLKKLTLWKFNQTSSLQTDAINIGFSEINKLKEILQLKKVFHNYGCYYPTHQYALNLFQGCIANIKAIWMSVCFKIKQITLIALKQHKISEREFMLISEAQVVQELLIQFVYGDKLSQKLPKQFRINQINLVKPQIIRLNDERNKKACVNNVLVVIKQKKVRKASGGSIDTFRQTKQSERIQQKLNTDQQIEIMDTIDELQGLVYYND